LKIDPKSHVPVYVQIVDLIRSAIAAGVYRAGEALPSLRVLAVDLGVNPNTVQKAFGELEREGLVAPRRGAGVFVARRGVESALGRAEGVVRQALRQGVRAGRDANLPAERVRALFDEAMDQVFNQARGRR
jgi:GntR family transcriptional regulator